MRLAPPLLLFMGAGRHAVETGDMSGVVATLEGARTFMLENQAIFEATSAVAPMEGGGADRVREVREDFVRALETFDELVRAVEGNSLPLLQKGMHDFETRVKTLLEDLSALGELEAERAPQSPMPVIDQFIKLGINVADGHVPPETLRARLPLLVDTIKNVRADIARFEVLYTAPADLVAGAREELSTLEAGVGALFQYFSTGTREALLDCLRLLKAGSARLMERLSGMDEQARAQSRFSRLVPVEEMARALEAWGMSRIDEGALRRVATVLHSLGHLYASQVDQLGRFPLAFTAREQWEAFRQAIVYLESLARPWFEKLQASPMAAASEPALLFALRDAYEGAATTMATLQAEVEANSHALAGAPRLEELVDCLGRISCAAATVDEAREILDRLVTQQDDLLSEIQQGGPNPSTAPMEELLLEQRQAVLEMGLYLDDGDETHLRSGFAQLKATQPRLLALHQETRKAVDAQRQARERTVSCFRCGATNPVQNRYCKGCNAVLPTMAPQDETVYTDIVGGEEVQGESAHLQRLRTLYDLAEGGGDLHAIMEELAKFHGQFVTTIADYDRTFGPKLESSEDPRVGEYGRLFRRNLDVLVEGVELMHLGAESANLDYMARGLELTLTAGEEMRQAQGEIRELMGSH